MPVVRLSTERIKSYGWRPSATSREALAASMQAMLDDARSRTLA